MSNEISESKLESVQSGVGNRGILYFLVLLSLLFAGCAGYGFWLVQYRFKDYEKLQTQWSGIANQIGIEQNNISNKINSFTAELDQIEKNVALEAEKLKENWAPEFDLLILREVSYLLQLARMQLNYGTDFASAIRFLKISQGKLHTITEPLLIDKVKVIMEGISWHISELQNSETPSMETIWGTIDKLDGFIKTTIFGNRELQLAGSKDEQEISGNQKEENQGTEKRNWKDALNKAWHGLTSKVRVKYRDKLGEIDGAENEFTKRLHYEQLKLLLEELRWASSAGQVGYFSTILQQLSSWSGENKVNLSIAELDIFNQHYRTLRLFVDARSSQDLSNIILMLQSVLS